MGEAGLEAAEFHSRHRPGVPGVIHKTVPLSVQILYSTGNLLGSTFTRGA
jgi:hypothetical protein